MRCIGRWGASCSAWAFGCGVLCDDGKEGGERGGQRVIQCLPLVRGLVGNKKGYGEAVIEK